MTATKVQSTDILLQYKQALSIGIAKTPSGCFTSPEGYTLFIEPLFNRVEILYKGRRAVLLQFCSDNTTWSEAHYGEFNPGNLRQIVELQNIFERIQESRNIYTVKKY